ncbi:MAG: hypothetical protein EXX96DRAFT_647913 [Benjaminiella poitrasii]|nr:MAG: hypothetical protein EXX96DRAFT_647913 [Benjaminiella poitrasii]
MDKFSLKGKTAVITGASRGIGYAMTKALASAGANVAMISTSVSKEVQAKCESVVKEYGIKSKTYAADIADAENIKSVMAEIYEEFGSIDVLVANAAIAANGASETFDLDLWKKIFDINVHGTFYTIQAASEYMLKQGKGSIIILSSISALVSNQPQFQTCYNASKGAVATMSKCLAYEWATRGIRVNCISPGYIQTEMLLEIGNKNLINQWTDLTPMKRLGTVEDLDGAVIFLASDASQYVTGLQLYVDGGYTAV